MQKVCNVSRVCYAGRAYYIYVRPLAGVIVAKFFSHINCEWHYKGKCPSEESCFLIICKMHHEHEEQTWGKICM